MLYLRNEKVAIVQNHTSYLKTSLPSPPPPCPKTACEKSCMCFYIDHNYSPYRKQSKNMTNNKPIVAHYTIEYNCKASPAQSLQIRGHGNLTFQNSEHKDNLWLKC